ncbi:unnamed protein product [Merluccius merluccius]
MASHVKRVTADRGEKATVFGGTEPIYEESDPSDRDLDVVTSRRRRVEDIVSVFSRHERWRRADADEREETLVDPGVGTQRSDISPRIISALWEMEAKLKPPAAAAAGEREDDEAE